MRLAAQATTFASLMPCRNDGSEMEIVFGAKRSRSVTTKRRLRLMSPAPDQPATASPFGCRKAARLLNGTV